MAIEVFDRIYQRAAERKGGERALEFLLSTPLNANELCQIPDHRYLSTMTKVIFQSGFVWRVIENKWPAFEEAFFGFEPEKMVMLGDAHIDRLLQDARIVRNGQKIATVPKNAQMILDVSKQHGSFAQFIADWPGTDITGLWLWLKKHGARLGGNSSAYLLRRMGKDTFVLSKDVVAHLIGAGVVDKAPSSQRDLKATQTAFNHWAEQSGRSLTEISQVIAYSVGDNRVQAE
ncbi:MULTISPECIES: DNA-3-methyladenine glycosylase I [Corallincola]|uniref:DNA-3-methyladenine glycosylase I n=3 Tax=Corallincola TaxID=1775176 RepID=A0A368N137_9GAMM|nr:MULTISPECIES: DNA-3-methyladenine glycosylase I [Corallincola]RCU43803.1 DNA-3-methyladenine glycosylase I [Corallincola holothuriorum]TAA46918.1 DNA-3-methyladenine glycosylase I [Corallincola spongiicola]TCI04566.1 DNA-3-methyladenine glycosylase I [Corallincola luteus]